MTIEEAIGHITIRKQNLDHIYGISLEEQVANEIRVHELDTVLEILREVNVLEVIREERL